MQLIGHDGDNIGIVPLGEAINRAQEVGLDLIEIAANTKPPVCKIMDSGKYKYELQKKANLARKKQKVILLKEIKLRPVTDVHDYDFKIKNAVKFLTNGDKVKFTIKFKGREMEFIKAAYDLVKPILEKVRRDKKQWDYTGIEKHERHHYGEKLSKLRGLKQSLRHI